MKKFDLFLFLKSLENLNEQHISSLQAFETSILMAMHDRWIASVISITNGIETLLRTQYGGAEDLARMIDLAVGDGLISAALGDRGHEIRRLRNKFIHNMVSPKDNPSAAYAYIVKSLPLYRKLAEGLINKIDVFDLIENEKIKLIYEITRKSILKSRRTNDAQEVQLSNLTVFKRIIINTTIGSIAPVWYSDKIDDWRKDHDSNRFPVDYDKLVDRYRDIISSIDTSIFDLGNEIICPAHPCTGNLVLEVSQSAILVDSPVDIIKSACCPLCDLMIDDQLQLKAFVEPQLPVEWLEHEIIGARGKHISDAKLVVHILGNIRFRLELRPVDRSLADVNVPDFLNHVDRGLEMSWPEKERRALRWFKD